MVKNADPVLEGAAGNRDVAFDLGEAERCVEVSARTVSTTGEVVEMAELRGNCVALSWVELFPTGQE